MMRVVTILVTIDLLGESLGDAQAKLVNRALIGEEKVEQPVVKLVFLRICLGYHSTTFTVVHTIGIDVHLLLEPEQMRVCADEED